MAASEFENFNKFLGALIKERRGEKFITQENLADETGISRTTINMLENGHCGIGLERALKIFEILDITLRDFGI